MRQGWKILLAAMAWMALAGCARTEAGTRLDCTMQSGVIQGCYADNNLLDDRELLERAARDTCTSQGEESCFLMIWSRQEGPLPAPGEIRSDLPAASYEWNQAEGLDCFMTFKNGMIEYASEGCPWD